MQDLGKITIDINEGGGSSAGGAGGSNLSDILPSKSDLAVGLVGNLMGPVVAAVAIAVKKIAEHLIAAAVKIYEAFMQLRRWVLEFADDIREYSPAVQLADLGNEMAMMGEKMRAAQMGGALVSSVVSAEGQVERSMFRIRSVLATAGAAVVAPVMQLVAKALKYLETWLPQIIDTIGKIIEMIGRAIQTAASFLPESMGGNFFKKLGLSIEAIGNDVRGIKINTEPEIDFSELNEPFLNDLRLMGARV